tara:strand:+ start:501 stop:1631 length:1131 start_codon:yes stop_codon:yes gene_type:complete
MNKKIFILSIFLLFTSITQSEGFYLLSNAPKVITNAITKSLETGSFSAIDLKILSDEEMKLCSQEESCIDAIRKKNSKAKILKFDISKGDLSSEVFITLINLGTSQIELNDYINCSGCSTIELIEAITSHNIKDTHFAHALFNEKFNYVDVSSGNDDLITMKFVSTPPANIFMQGQAVGISPLELSAKKNTKIDIEFIEINHKKLKKSLRFDKNREYIYELIPIVGSVLLKSTPSRADIYIDGKKQGRTPKEIKNIKLTEIINIELILKNHISEEISFKPKTESKEVINVDFEKGQGFVKISHDGESKKIFVYVNGALKGLLSNYKNDTLVLDAGKNKIDLVQDDVKRNESFEVEMDAFEIWKISFVESVEVSISF